MRSYEATFAHLFLALGGVAAIASSGCSRPLSDDECRLMLDKYVGMSAEADPRVAGSQGLAHETIKDGLLTQKHHDAAYAMARARCRDEVSRSAYECAMAVPTPNEWEACVQ